VIYLHYAIVAFICWAVFCRARLMTSGTHRAVKAQYGVLMVSALASLPIFGLDDFAPQLIGGAMCLYLWLDSQKWRGHPPMTLRDLHEREVRRMFGPRK